MNLSNRKKLLILFFILLASIALGVYYGSVKIPLGEIFSQANRNILQLRLARIMLGLLAGAGLGVSGAVLQAILRNPLAEPYLLGTSSGAGLGAALGIFLGLSVSLLPLAAFAGALLSIILVYNLAKQNGRISAQSLILSGVIVAIAISGLIVFLVSISSNQALRGILWWLLGSLEVYNFKLLLIVGSIVSLGIVPIFILSQDLNAISIGEEEAIHLGIEIETVKKILFVITALVTGALVSITGIIGFVGLIIPHMMRMVVGPNHKILIPATCLAGAAFLILSDTLARSLFPPVEISIGVITSLVGAPIFIFLLRREQRVK